MLDSFNRNINYLRISVTDRCNLRCHYCMPECGVKMMDHKDILRFEEIEKIVRFGVHHGIDKVRLTGGEPLVRKGIVDLVKMLSQIDGIRDLAMTTNGTLLDQFARPLKSAGLHRVNVSLDTMDAEKYREITRGGNLTSVLRGIEEASKAELFPIRINCVVNQSAMEADAQGVARYCSQNNLQVRFIKQMDLENGIFSKVIGGEGGNCAVCNRLRISSNGKLKPCLFSDIEIDIREVGIEQAFARAMGLKPISGTQSKKNKFSNIGG